MNRTGSIAFMLLIVASFVTLSACNTVLRTKTVITPIPPLPGQTNSRIVTNVIALSRSQAIRPPPPAPTNITLMAVEMDGRIVTGPNLHPGDQGVICLGQWIQRQPVGTANAWSNYFFVPALGSNAAIAVPINRLVTGFEYRYGQAVWATTNL